MLCPKKKNKLFIIIFCISLVSCGKFSDEKCEGLSMSSFRGDVDADFQLKKGCSHYSPHYTHKLCQKAMEELIMKGSTQDLQKQFGERVTECFTKDDMKKFLRPSHVSN